MGKCIISVLCHQLCIKFIACIACDIGISHGILPIGKLSQEAEEVINKHIKKYRNIFFNKMFTQSLQ